MGILDDILGALEITQIPGGQSDYAPCFGLKPALGGISVTDTIAGAVDLNFLTKDVLFQDAKLEPSLVDAALNPKILEGLPSGGLASSLLAGGKAPGLLGQIEGTLPFAAELPVSASVEWTVKDDAGSPLSSGEFSTRDLGDNRVCIRLPVPFVEATLSPTRVMKCFRVGAKVTLSAGQSQTVERELPEMEVCIPGVPVPTVLAFFLHTNFNGAALVVVPGDSPIDSTGTLQRTLQDLEQALQPLNSAANVADFLLPLGMLGNILTTQGHVQFRRAESIADLNDITLIQRGWLDNDTEAEDELSSLIFLGVPGKMAEGFRHTDFDEAGGLLEGGRGKFTVTVSDKLFTLVPSLHSRNPATQPGGMLEASSDADQFGDELSSVRFVRA